MDVTVEGIQPSEIKKLWKLIGLMDADGSNRKARLTQRALAQALFAEEPQSRILVAKRDQELVGVAVFQSLTSSFGTNAGFYLDDLFVVQSERGQGIGRLLMKRLAALALAEGRHRIDWNLFLSNRRGAKFYASLGAETFHACRTCRLDLRALKTLNK